MKPVFIHNDWLMATSLIFDSNNFGGFASIKDRNDFIEECEIEVPEDHVLIAEYSWHRPNADGSALLYIDTNGNLFIQIEEDDLEPSTFQDWERLVADYDSSTVWG